MIDLAKFSTADLLRMLLDKNERREAWECHAQWSSRSHFDDAVLLDDIVRSLAARIDSKERR